MSSDLVMFLRARLDEDERVARGGAQLHEDEPADPSYAGGIADLEAAGWEPGAARRFNTYVARFDPARILCEIEAKRRILALLASALTAPVITINGPDLFPLPGDRRERALVMARLLALPYTDHPDYRHEWRP